MVFGVTSAIILLLDQLSKLFLLEQTTLPWWWIEYDVGFDLTMNPGIAFSLPITGNLSISLSIIVISILLLLKYRSTLPHFLTQVSFGLVIGGAFGNLADRIRLGAVVDFLQVYSFPTFNIADAAISIGFALMLIFHRKIFKKEIYRN